MASNLNPVVPTKAVQYPCKKCGKRKGDHKAVTFHCPIKGPSRSFRSFCKDDQYEPDLKKPREIGWQI